MVSAINTCTNLSSLLYLFEGYGKLLNEIHRILRCGPKVYRYHIRMRNSRSGRDLRGKHFRLKSHETVPSKEINMKMTLPGPVLLDLAQEFIGFSVWIKGLDELCWDLATPLVDGQTSWVYCITLVQSLYISYISSNKLMLSYLSLCLLPQLSQLFLKNFFSWFFPQKVFVQNTSGC